MILFLFLLTLAKAEWTQQVIYQGEDFLQGWNFFTGPDPTGGFVNYVDEQTALSEGLIKFPGNGQMYMGAG